MSNYFKTVNTKSCIESKEIFNSDDCKFESLLDYYNNRQTRPIESDLENVDMMFKRWCDLLFNNFNIVVHGRQSKFRLLETFKARYLDSGRIPDFKCLSPKNGTSTLDITTVKLHGFTPVTMERFCHSLFDVKDDHSDIEQVRGEFLIEAKKKQIHYVFLIHSFELLYQNSKPICDIIFQMYKCEPDYIHILLSSDHIYSGKILHKFKYQLNFIFYNVNYGESFFHEKTHTFAGIEQDNDNNDIVDNIFAGQLDLTSLKDIYQAFQPGCKAIMIYILENFVDATKENEAEAIRERERRSSRRLITHQVARSAEIDFDKLFDHCQTKFIAHRANVLRNHLEELKDHGIIAIEDKTNKISCLMGVEVCKKFLDSMNFS